MILIFLDNQGKMAGLEACWSDVKADPNRFEAYLAIANQRNEKATVLSEDEKEAKAMNIRKEIQKHVGHDKFVKIMLQPRPGQAKLCFLCLIMQINASFLYLDNASLKALNLFHYQNVKKS